MAKFLYRTILRPASTWTLPPKVAWEYVEVPPGLTTRPDLPTSKYLFGVIALDRKLTKDELVRFDILPMD